MNILGRIITSPGSGSLLVVSLPVTGPTSTLIYPIGPRPPSTQRPVSHVWHTRGEIFVMWCTAVTACSNNISFTFALGCMRVTILCCHPGICAAAFLAVRVSIVTGSTLGTVRESCITRLAASTVCSPNIGVTQTRPSVSITHRTCHSIRVAATSYTLIVP